LSPLHSSHSLTSVIVTSRRLSAAVSSSPVFLGIELQYSSPSQKFQPRYECSLVGMPTPVPACESEDPDFKCQRFDLELEDFICEVVVAVKSDRSVASLQKSPKFKPERNVIAFQLRSATGKHSPFFGADIEAPPTDGSFCKIRGDVCELIHLPEQLQYHPSAAWASERLRAINCEPLRLLGISGTYALQSADTLIGTCRIPETGIQQLAFHWGENECADLPSEMKRSYESQSVSSTEAANSTPMSKSEEKEATELTTSESQLSIEPSLATVCSFGTTFSGTGSNKKSAFLPRAHGLNTGTRSFSVSCWIRTSMQVSS
jgi:hypothetical protein